MAGRLIPARADDVRAAIARAMLGEADPTPTLGGITLRPHQVDAVRRLRAALESHGGALLADATGLGKTYVAIALAREAGRPLIVAPAGLREMWREAMRAADVRAPLVSLESLGRGPVPAMRPDLVVVDEAHHARNPATRRHRALGALSAAARVLLLTATPVHNRTGDLDSLLSLFLGGRARRLDAADLARCVVRRTDAGGDHIPRVLPPEPIDPAGSDEPLAALLALPPPVPAADAGEGGALVLLGLVRQWASSEGALRAALRRRAAAGTALLAALESGSHLTRAELRRWVVGDDTVQLELAGLSAETRGDERLRAAVEAHLAGVRAALRALRDHGGADARRAAALVALRERHAGERIVAFSQFADTVRALFFEMRGEPRVAALSAAGAIVAGGRIARADAVARFAPRAHGRGEPRAAERIDLLLTTDLLSEGVNLQDASVVVHLDLPWTPARLEQRVGRLARLGAMHERVAVYVMRPPAAAGARLAMERRLRAKIDAAARVAGTGLPGALDPVETLRAAGPSSVPAAAEEIRALLARWRAAADAPVMQQGPLVAACRARERAWIALLGGGSPRLLVAIDRGEPTEEPEVVLRALALADGASTIDATTPAAARAVGDAVRALDRERSRRDSADALDLSRVAASPDRRAVIRRIASIPARAPLHRRAALAPLVARARLVALAPGGLGAERMLGELAGAPLSDEAWLDALLRFGEARPRRAGPDGDDPTALRALLVSCVE